MMAKRVRQTPIQKQVKNFVFQTDLTTKYPYL